MLGLKTDLFERKRIHYSLAVVDHIFCGNLNSACFLNVCDRAEIRQLFTNQNKDAVIRQQSGVCVVTWAFSVVCLFRFCIGCGKFRVARVIGFVSGVGIQR